MQFQHGHWYRRPLAVGGVAVALALPSAAAWGQTAGHPHPAHYAGHQAVSHGALVHHEKVGAGQHSSSSALAPTMDNGGFETGDFTGWGTFDRGFGTWTVSKGTSSPISGFRIPGPPEGRWQAVADQEGPGVHILYRDIVVGADPLELDLTLWYRNRAGEFFTPPELFPNRDPRRNQQVRVDLVSPTASLRSMADDAILENIFRTKRGDANRMPPTVLRTDLTSFEGQTVRLRIVVVDNQFFLQAGADNAQLVDLPAADQP